MKTVGEVVPDLGEKLSNIKPETINDVGPLLFDGGARTLSPVPRRALAPVTEQLDTLEIADIRDIANDFEALSGLADKKEPEDYAEKCQGQFLDASWKAFTAKEGGYYEKAKAASDSLRTCWKAVVKHFESTISKPVVDPDAALEDN